MAVKPSDLDNPERGLDLTTRGPAANVVTAPPLAAALADLQALRGRLEAAKRTTPQPGDFARGWRSAIRAIEGEG